MTGRACMDLDHVETHRAVLRMTAKRIHFGGAPQTALLERMDRFGGRAARCRAPGLDLDEHQRIAVERNQVDLGARCAEVALKDAIAAPPEMALGDTLAAPPQRHPVQPGERGESEIPPTAD